MTKNNGKGKSKQAIIIEKRGRNLPPTKPPTPMPSTKPPKDSGNKDKK